MKNNLSPELLEKRKKTNKKILTFGCLPIILIVIGVLIFESSGNDKNVEKIATSDSAMAYIISQNVVKGNLNYPEEADFPMMGYEVLEYADNVYRVHSTVTSKNGFGVKIKKSYECTIQYLGGDETERTNWKVVDFTFF